MQDLVYADDLATCIVARSAAALPDATRLVAGRTLDVLAGHGLRANIGPRKTAALMSLVGPGSRQVRRKVFSEGQGRLPILRENGTGVWLSAVSEYRHLGSVLTFDGSLVSEVRAKLRNARANFNEGRKDVFCTPRVALARRIGLFRTHVLSSLLAGAGGWPVLDQASWSSLEAGLTRMLRQLLRIPRSEDQRWTREQMHAALGMPTLPGLLALERLRFLAQLVRGAPDPAFAVLQQAPRALQAFRNAEAWLLEALRDTGAPGPFDSHWEAWCAIFAQPGRWKGMLKRAEQWHVGKLRAEAQFQVFVRSVWDPVPAPVVDVTTATHMCLLCRVAFFDQHAWSAHAAKTHGFRAKSRRLAVGVRCRACAAHLGTLVRHRRHLQTSLRCRQAVEWELPGLFPVVEEAVGHAQAVTIEGHGVAHLPAVQEEISVPLLQQLRAGEARTDESIFEAVTRTVEPLPVLKATLARWMEELPPGPQREAAADVGLCLQVDLLAESVSGAPGPSPGPDQVFRPLLLPWPPVCPGRGQVIVVGDFPVPIGLAVGMRLGFRDARPALGSFSALAVALPPPRIACAAFWQPGSCRLRALRPYLDWLHHCLDWLSLVLRASAVGVPCQLRIGFPSSQGGALAEWLEQIRCSSLEPYALDFCFTS